MSVSASQTAQRLAEDGQAHYRSGRHREAVRLFRLALTVDPERRATTLLFASALELSRARTGFPNAARRASILQPAEATAWKLAMRASFSLERMGEAAERSTRHLVLDPGSWNGWFILARARARRGRQDHAVSALRKARVLAPGDSDTVRALARSLFRSGDFQAAFGVSESLSALGAGGSEHDFERARIARAANRMDIAAPLLDTLVSVDPGYAEKRRFLELTTRVQDLRAL
jgi:Flp pilus assembly protein TadD